MAYDDDDRAAGRSPGCVGGTGHHAGVPVPTDVEALLLVEVAAICLSTVSKPSFTRDELVQEVLRCAGDDYAVDDDQLQRLIREAEFLVQDANGLFTVR